MIESGSRVDGTGNGQDFGKQGEAASDASILHPDVGFAYGAELDEGRDRDPAQPAGANVSYGALAKNYPSYDDYPSKPDPFAPDKTPIWDFIGGKVNENRDFFKNSCAIRLSHALNKSGLLIPFIPGETSSGTGPNGETWWYIPRLDDMSQYLSSQFGKPQSFTPEQFKKNKNSGVVIFQIPWNDATGHVDLWDGSNTIDGHNDYIGKSKRILFWKLEN